MAQQSGPPPIVFILIFLVLATLLLDKEPIRKTRLVATQSLTGAPPPAPPTPAPPPLAPPPPPPKANASSFPPPAPGSVPAGTTVRIDGSTSMVSINKNLKNGFQGQFPGTTVVTKSNGSNPGIEAILAGSADIAAISRPLNSQEQGQGLVAVPIAKDQIAVVVGKANPFSGGLTSAQVVQIFQGQIADWSAVGGRAGQIKVINRPKISGTHQTFKEMVLKGGNFGTTPNITTLAQDATTPVLQALGNNGIGYATYAQVASQQKVRTVPIDGVAPGSSNYPYQRTLFYVYKNPPTPPVKAFLGYTTSPQGNLAMFASN